MTNDHGEDFRRDLQRHTTGEVRFDQISRALYSTDASVYRIEPQGVVLPRSREDLIRVVRICAEHGCSMTMRGGGTSQAGQAIGPGVIVDTSKYLNRVLELNVEQLRARHFDRQPRHGGRHDGQQFQRRAFRTVRQDHRSRPRTGSRAV
jgi:hypothetical protein